MNIRIEGEENLVEVQKRFEAWAALYPAVMKKVLKAALKVLQKDVKARLRSNLRKKSGRTASSVTTKVLMKGKYAVDGEVYPKDPLARMIAAVNEQGTTRQMPGGQPYIISRRTGRAIFISKKSEFANGLPRTKPSTSHVPARPSFQPALRAERPKVLKQMREGLMEAYRKSKKTVVSGLLE